MERHNFYASRDAGKRGEAQLDRYFEQFYDVIRELTLDEELLIAADRIFQIESTGHRVSVEYKTDDKATDTGNIFVETVSNDVSGAPGWAYSSLAQVIVIYLPREGFAYFANAVRIKQSLDTWRKVYLEKRVWNDGYFTRGLCVPRPDFEAVCFAAKQIFYVKKLAS